MPHFFIDEEISCDRFTVGGEDGRHIVKSLRMSVGEALTLCSPSGTLHEGSISGITADTVEVAISSHTPSQAEPNVRVSLYQALPKGDKMEFIIQKAVELGVTEIVPVISSRCISRPDSKSLDKKLARWQKIAKQAAMQSGRGIIPKVRGCISFKEAVRTAGGEKIIFYELGGERVRDILTDKPEELSIFIGSEGGFSSEEVSAVTQSGGKTATLGKRILRAETAPLAALAIIMYQTGNME